MKFFILWNYFRNIIEFQTSSSKWFFDWQDTDEVMISKYFYLDLIQIAMPPGVWGDQRSKKRRIDSAAMCACYIGETPSSEAKNHLL